MLCTLDDVGLGLFGGLKAEQDIAPIGESVNGPDYMP